MTDQNTDSKKAKATLFPIAPYGRDMKMLKKIITFLSAMNSLFTRSKQHIYSLLFKRYLLFLFASSFAEFINEIICALTKSYL